MNLTHEELVRALLDAQPKPEAAIEDAFTTEEWAEMLDKPLSTTGRFIKRACKTGRMEGLRDWRGTSVGHMQRYPVFRLVKEAA